MPKPVSRHVQPHAGNVQLGLSVSIPEDLEKKDLGASDLNRFMVRLTRIALDRQGSVVSGHDWRAHGIMRALLQFARRYSTTLEDGAVASPSLRNFVAWPDRPALDERQLAGLANVLRVEARPLPAWCRQALDHLGQPGHAHEGIARMLALSDVRVHVTQATSARVCLGGNRSSFSGRYSGVLEEIALALAARQPVYLVGWAGGATSDVIELLRKNKEPKDLHSAELDEGDLPAAFDRLRSRLKRAAQNNKFPDWVPAPLSPWAWSTPELIDYIRGRKADFSRESNGLFPSENTRLWTTSSTEESIDLIVLGLTRLGLIPSQGETNVHEKGDGTIEKLRPHPPRLRGGVKARRVKKSKKKAYRPRAS